MLLKFEGFIIFENLINSVTSNSSKSRLIFFIFIFVLIKDKKSTYTCKFLIGINDPL